MNIKKLNEKLQESLDDLDNIESISKNALKRDNTNKTNKQGRAYLSRGGDSYNYNKILRDVLTFISTKDMELYNTINSMLPKIKEQYRIRRNKNYQTIIQNDNDNRIAKYKYKINLDKEE